jgi:hypothetical protein
MEHFEDYNTYIAGVLGLLTLGLLYVLLRNDVEAAVLYNVIPPEQSRLGWKGEILEEPSLKVHLNLWTLMAQLTLLRFLAPLSFNVTPPQLANLSAASIPQASTPSIAQSPKL